MDHGLVNQLILCLFSLSNERTCASVFSLHFQLQREWLRLELIFFGNHSHRSHSPCEFSLKLFVVPSAVGMPTEKEKQRNSHVHELREGSLHKWIMAPSCTRYKQRWQKAFTLRPSCEFISPGIFILNIFLKYFRIHFILHRCGARPHTYTYTSY